MSTANPYLHQNTCTSPLKLAKVEIVKRYVGSIFSVSTKVCNQVLVYCSSEKIDSEIFWHHKRTTKTEAEGTIRKDWEKIESSEGYGKLQMGILQSKSIHRLTNSRVLLLLLFCIFCSVSKMDNRLLLYQYCVIILLLSSSSAQLVLEIPAQPKKELSISLRSSSSYCL